MPSILVFFRKGDCNSCSTRSLYTRAKGGPRGLKLRPRAQHEALQDTRARFKSEQGQLEYQLRAGVEGTLSQGVGAFGLRKTRYRGLMNLVRFQTYLQGVPQERGSDSRFSALAA